jgi:hypothetical protein
MNFSAMMCDSSLSIYACCSDRLFEKTGSRFVWIGKSIGRCLFCQAKIAFITTGRNRYECKGPDPAPHGVSHADAGKISVDVYAQNP